MNFFANKRNLFLSFFLILLLLTIPLTLLVVKQRQEQRSRASSSTSLSFSPTSSTANPIQKNVNDDVSLDLMVNPGSSNMVTFVKFQVTYDPTKLQLSSSNPFTLNTASFPTQVEGPILGNGKLAESVSVGSDPTKAIQKPTKVGTINFKAIGPTNGTPTTVTFTNITQALSSGPNDQAGENVLSTTTPANIVISGTAPSGTTTPSTAVSTAPTPQPTAVSTVLSFAVLLHGVGSAGDNPNPSGNSLSNKNPLHPQRNLDVWIYDSNNNLVSSVSGDMIYNAGNGDFEGTIDLGQTFKTGSYNIKIKSDRYLRKLLPGIQTINNLQLNTIPQVDLVAGDVNGDNVLNVLDYNAFLDCGYGAINPLPMADANAVFNTSACQVHTPAQDVDVNDDGIIDSTDYNLFLRELSVQNGD